ncbi:HesA/MoeB/ThiF family protein [Candidatus Bathyarchaeota archaeon]|nr:HesA/MoeB/ThiF family protein [Candidatus Bathyarchaeota archaeon]
MSLSQQELERYSRQIIMNGWGTEGQRKLKNSAAAVVGVGGLGSISSTLLAAAGVGKLVLIDQDKLCLSDLNRQILYSTKDIGQFKVEIAKERLTALNPEVEILAVNKEITVDNVSRVIGKVNIVVDGLDNWKTRFTVNDYCVKSRIPFVHAGVSQFYGQITTVMPSKGPCLRCVFPKEPTETKVNPIFSGTPSALASLQVMEAIKCLTGIGKPLIGRMLFIDGEEMTIETAEITKNQNCPTCSKI